MSRTVKGVFVGRLCPLHLGHQLVILAMSHEWGADKSLVLIGSSNSELSLRHFFSYNERRELIRTMFPQIQVAGLPDYETDSEWLQALDDLLVLAGGDPAEVTFYGGCEEDVSFFTNAGRRVSILNRFDGTTPKISATEVRDALIHERSLDGLVDIAIQEQVKQLFAKKWEHFKRI